MSNKSNKMEEQSLITLATSIIEGNQKSAVDALEEVLRLGTHPDEIIRCLKRAMDEVAIRTKYFIPPRYASSEAVSLVLDRLRPHLKIRQQLPSKVVIGTVEGDIHDLGKNLVKTTLEMAGYDVYDLGRNVLPYQYVYKVEEVKAAVCALSATMTPSLNKMRETIDVLRKETGVKILIGGHATTPADVLRLGADAHGEDEAEAVKALNEVVEVVQ